MHSCNPVAVGVLVVLSVALELHPRTHSFLCVHATHAPTLTKGDTLSQCTCSDQFMRVHKDFNDLDFSLSAVKCAGAGSSALLLQQQGCLWIPCFLQHLVYRLA